MGSKGIDGYQTWTSQLSTNRASPVNFSSNFEYPFCQITQKKSFIKFKKIISIYTCEKAILNLKKETTSLYQDLSMKFWIHLTWAWGSLTIKI